MSDQLTRIAVLQNLETVLRQLGLNAETELAKLGMNMDMSFLGVLAVFLQTSSTLGEAMQEISQYNHVHHAQPVTWRLEVLGSTATFNLYLDAKGLTVSQHRLAVDLGVGHAYRVIEALTENKVRFKRVMLRCDNASDVHNYRRFFHAPIEFNAEADGLVFSAGDLAMPLLRPDSQMHEAHTATLSS